MNEGRAKYGEFATTSGRRHEQAAENQVNVKGTVVAVLAHREQDYISLTDIARHKNPELTDDLIRNWLRNRNTIEFLGIWESLNNPGFKPVEFDGLKRMPA